MEPFIGQIQNFGFNFAPRGWAMCNGQLLPINQNQALFSLLGTTYGGDGRTTFALPDLRGRVGLHEGTGPGLTQRPLGQRSGQETVTLTTQQIPSHSHPTTVTVSNESGEEENVSGQIIANHPGAFNEDPSPGQTLGGVTSLAAGGGQAINNMQPYLVTNYCIALTGIFPSRS